MPSPSSPENQSLAVQPLPQPPPLSAGGSIPYASWRTDRVGGPARDGKIVVVPDQAYLGPLCVKCGQPGDEKPYVRKLTWYPPWVIIIVLLSLLIGVIVMLLLQKKGTVTCHLCSDHRRRRNKFIAITWVLGLLIPACLVALIGFAANSKSGNNYGLYAMASVGGFFAFLIAALVTGGIARIFTVNRIKDGIIRLKGAGPAFLATLPPLAQD